MVSDVCPVLMSSFRFFAFTNHDYIEGAKHLTKGNLIRSIHPLIKGADPDRCNDMVLDKADFVRSLQTFRPAQTVFETGKFICS
jgi:hypothetical protein